MFKYLYQQNAAIVTMLQADSAPADAVRLVVPGPKLDQAALAVKESQIQAYTNKKTLPGDV